MGGGGIGISSACLVYRILVGECCEYRRTCLGNLRYFENSNNTKCGQEHCGNISCTREFNL